MFQKWQDEMDKGSLAYKMRDFVSAEKHFEAAASEAEKFGHNNLSLAQSLEKIGEAMLGQVPLEDLRAEACFRHYERALSIYEAVHGPVHMKVAECLTMMARLVFWYNTEEAENCARHAASIFEELNSDQYYEPMEVLIGLASLSDKNEERDAMMHQLIEKFEKKADTAPVPLAKSLISMARRVDNDVAIPQFKRALGLLSNSDETELIVAANVALGKLLFQEEEFLDAESCFKTAFQLGECAPNVAGMHLEEALCRRARIQCHLYQNFDEAERLLKQAESMREPNGHKPIGSGFEIERGQLAKARHDFKWQEEEYRKELKQAQDKLQTDSSEWKSIHESSIIMQRLSLAALVYRIGDPEEAAELWASVHRDGHPGSWMQSKATFRLAIHYAKTGRVDEAKDLSSHGLKHLSEEASSDNIAIAIISQHLIGASDAIEPLLESLKKQLKQAKEELDDEYGMVSAILSSLAYAYAGLGQLDKAEECVDGIFASEKKDSLFTAVAYEEWSMPFEQEGFGNISKRLRDRAKTIRANILARIS